MTQSQIPVLIEFVPGSRFLPKQEGETRGVSTVLLADGRCVEVPEDQVIFADEKSGQARLGLGGMSYEGIRDDRFELWRVRDLWPEDRIAVSSEQRILVAREMVSRILLEGAQVYPPPELPKN
jgi:hypothetical protein